MAEKNRALYLCRHCQAMVYVEAASVIKPPCPGCFNSNYESVFVPVYAQASQAVSYMLLGVAPAQPGEARMTRSF